VNGMTIEGRRALWIATLWPMVVGALALILLGAFLLSFQSFATGYVRAVGGVSSASLASRVTTTWPDANGSHAVQTTRQPGQDVVDWGRVHLDELHGMSVVLDSK